MNAIKKCSACNKTVYPVEELKCLDLFWHKACFKCQVCGMTLNMKNYKGYDKKPYCNAHYPTTKFTAIADTPENMRLSNQTKNQSNIAYHADFNREKGRFTSVSDDPETMRLRNATEIASNVSYHNVKGQREVMEKNRPEYEDEMQVQGGQRQVGRIEDYEGPHDGYGGPRGQPPPQAYQQQQAYRPPQQQYQPPQPQAYNPPPQPAQSQGGAKNRGNVYRAIYDYTAGDTDEVSFRDGDIIIQCQPIDEGWMEGRVERTGQYGMLPSNYVERA